MNISLVVIVFLGVAITLIDQTDSLFNYRRRPSLRQRLVARRLGRRLPTARMPSRGQRLAIRRPASGRKSPITSIQRSNTANKKEIKQTIIIARTANILSPVSNQNNGKTAISSRGAGGVQNGHRMPSVRKTVTRTSRRQTLRNRAAAQRALNARRAGHGAGPRRRPTAQSSGHFAPGHGHVAGGPSGNQGQTFIASQGTNVHGPHAPHHTGASHHGSATAPHLNGGHGAGAFNRHSGSPMPGEGHLNGGHGASLFGTGHLNGGHGASLSRAGHLNGGQGASLSGAGHLNVGHGVSTSGAGHFNGGHGASLSGAGNLNGGHGASFSGTGHQRGGHGASFSGAGHQNGGHGASLSGASHLNGGHGASSGAGHLNGGHGTATSGSGHLSSGHGSPQSGSGHFNGGHSAPLSGNTHGQNANFIDLPHGPSSGTHGGNTGGHGNAVNGHGSPVHNTHGTGHHGGAADHGSPSGIIARFSSNGQQIPTNINVDPTSISNLIGQVTGPNAGQQGQNNFLDALLLDAQGPLMDTSTLLNSLLNPDGGNAVGSNSFNGAHAGPNSAMNGGHAGQGAHGGSHGGHNTHGQGGGHGVIGGTSFNVPTQHNHQHPGSSHGAGQARTAKGPTSVVSTGSGRDNPVIIETGRDVNVGFKVNKHGQPTIVIGRQSPPPQTHHALMTEEAILENSLSAGIEP